jgi:hypothetical protein
MTNQELFKQAIADAKSVRDAAVANAKAALEETFTPKIMSMLSAKLNEMEDDVEEGKKVEEEGKNMEEEGMESAVGYEAGHQKPDIEEEGYEEGAKSMEEMDLEEILAELEKEEEGKMEEGKKEDMEEAKKTEEEGKKVEEAKKDEDKKKVEESLEEADGDDEMTELTVDELKDIIRDVLKDVMGAEEEEAGEEASEEGEEEVEVDDEESINLDELLAELEKEEEGKKMEEAKEEEGKKMEEAKKEDDKKVEEAKKEVKKAKEDLEEAIKVIKFLKKELNEVNLLNAKNTYVNKIFKSKNLSEAQKVNVLKSMDKATNVKEAKNIYEALTETLSTKKSSIKESIGFASKAAGVAPKQPIVESDAAIRRMQQLAGIIK